MKIGITGGTGFVGRSLIRQLAAEGHELRGWKRTHSNTDSIPEGSIAWLNGQLGNQNDADTLTEGCNAIVHSAFWRPGKAFRGNEGDIIKFAQTNILGTLQLIESAIKNGVERFIFVSTCAVHEKILDDRPLDEAHPLWPYSHYGAHKAAIEKFVHSYGLGTGYPICSIRPTGIYGVQHPVEDSKWYEIVQDVVRGQDVEVTGGGKEVHVDDVARGIRVLLDSPTESITGESFACYDRYISRYEVASIAKEMTGSSSQILGEPKSPKHEINTNKIKAQGMTFGGTELLNATVETLVEHVQENAQT